MGSGTLQEEEEEEELIVQAYGLRSSCCFTRILFYTLNLYGYTLL